MPYVGEGTLRSYVATPLERCSSTTAIINSSVLLHQISHDSHDNFEDIGADGESVKWLRVVSAPTKRLGHGRLPLLGFSLDNTFVIADAQLRCRDGEHYEKGLRCDGGSMRDVWASDAQAALDTIVPALLKAAASAATENDHALRVSEQRRMSVDQDTKEPPRPLIDEKLNDPVTTYAVGNKKMLVIIACPQDSPDCASQSYPYGYCYGKVASVHGCSDAGVNGYVSTVMSTTNTYFESASWRTLRMSTTVTPILKLPYSGSQCGANPTLKFWAGGDPDAFDMMAYAAARARGYEVSDFDFNLIFMPRCPATGWSGIGWIGVPGAILWTYGYDYDSSASHEVGHNLGANHASIMSGGSRGAKAWKDSSNTWSEYGNPHSTMGAGNIDKVQADFMIPSKVTFDWAPTSVLREVVPFSSTGAALCGKPSCGPFFLTATDTGSTSPTGAVYGFQIATAVNDRFYYVEHRTGTTQGNAALISWSDVEPTSGRTGIVENTVLTDCTPGTSDWKDAGCKPGSSIVLDVGTASRSQRVIIVVGAVSSGLLQVDVSTDLSFRGIASAPTPKPTSPPPPPTQAPVMPEPPTPSPVITPIESPTHSESTCDDLGWSNANQYGSSNVCGESDDDLGGCDSASTWGQAVDKCTASGARLCTLAELQNDETRGTGCSFDSEMVWSSTPCGANVHALSVGGSNYGSKSECDADSSPRAVRCCADTLGR